MSFWTGFSKNAFSNLSIDWLGKRKMAYVLSGIIIVAGFVSMAVRGFELGVDFKGGYSYNIQFDEGQNVSADDLRAALSSDATLISRRVLFMLPYWPYYLSSSTYLLDLIAGNIVRVRLQPCSTIH